MGSGVGAGVGVGVGAGVGVGSGEGSATSSAGAAVGLGAGGAISPQPKSRDTHISGKIMPAKFLFLFDISFSAPRFSRSFHISIRKFRRRGIPG